MSQEGRIPLAASLRLLHQARLEGDVVISAMGAAREWMGLGQHPLDWVFVPSSMGQATSLGLGMALARPDRRVIVLNGCRALGACCRAREPVRPPSARPSKPPARKSVDRARDA